ncbi:ammonia-dependent NAD(+) synthetase [Eremococcus coleocola]|uniref:NH(3)-dependent NAD(+) synthetase n=1 Tax=Eremococcus coleocola ACS-139-V-Col8 TaxID=908337 RepID=E4KNM6_9LACT|nr:ammonia-dependent NAD(+) synthetase [Eremococcus coleocola]EFR31432.1 NAD+ synthase [Eremococcus coleocola ACS-139-V-Col8]
MRPLQAQIIESLKVKASIDPEQEVRRSIDWMKQYLMDRPFLKSLVLGISGGQDSTLAGRLCQLTVEELRQETGQADYRFIAIRLPYGLQADEDDAQMALDFIQADQELTINIKAATDAVVAAVEANEGMKISDFNKGNIKARQRMIAQYAVAGDNQGLVVGTDHAAEAITGFYTKFGDGAADIMPLWRLNKSQGRQLLAYLEAPKALYEKVPTADLEEDKPQLPDEQALGVSYQAIDDYLIGKAIADKEAERIEDLYRKSQHKRDLPYNVYSDL